MARGATILGEFLGSGSVTEATGILDVRPDGSGLVRAIQIALRTAGLDASDVGMIVAHGNGTRASDATEAEMLAEAGVTVAYQEQELVYRPGATVFGLTACFCMVLMPCARLTTSSIR